MIHSPLEATPVFHLGPVVITGTVVTTWALMLILAIVCRMVTRKFSIIPDGTQATVETLVGTVEEQIQGIINRDGSEFLPLIGTLFIFLVVANLSRFVQAAQLDLS